jgi:hypothetical protein
MERHPVEILFLFQPQADYDIWLKEKQPLQAYQNYVKGRIRASEETRGRKRTIIGLQEATKDGTEAKSRYWMVPVASDLQTPRNA